MTESQQPSFGRVDADGNVFVRTISGEVNVGQYAAGTPEEGLAFFERKYADLVAEGRLCLDRMVQGRGSVEAAREIAARLDAQVAEPHVVGDLTALTVLAGALVQAAEAMAAERAEQKAAAKAEALAKRTLLVEAAEKLANSTAWKTTQAEFEKLLEEWKGLTRGDRAAEQELWKRFSAARQTFDRARRTHFAELSKASAAAKEAKNAILAEAQKLATSTDWGKATIEFRNLLDRWKAAPRGSKKEEDALWAKFREFQQAFYAAKDAANAVRDQEYAGNLEAKLAILAEAEALLPITNLAQAKAAFRKIGERFAKAGHVPRSEMAKIDARWQAVSKAIAAAEDEEWKKSDPGRKAFVASTATKFQENVDRLETALAAAKAKGEANLQALELQLASAKALLEAALKHL